METKKKKTFKEKWEDFKLGFEFWWDDIELYRVGIFYFTLISGGIIGVATAIIAVLHAFGVI